MHIPTMLIVLDGFGHSKKNEGNAIASSHMPFWHYLCANYPSALLHASGPDVGLLPGFVGNSEVGHMTLGSGRVTPSVLKRFHEEIDSGSFFKNKILTEKIISLKESGGALHLMGLLSDAGVHSHEYHLQAIIKLAHILGLSRVFIHVFLDGRDTLPTSAKLYLQRLDDYCSAWQCGSIATIQGRFYSMDRDNNWQRTQRAYQALIGYLVPQAATWQIALEQAYHTGTTDEFVPPYLINPDGIIRPGDGVVFFNFRPDRARQLTQAFIDPNFTHFENMLNTGNGRLAFFVTTTRYSQDFALFNNQILFKQDPITHTLLDQIALQSSNPPPTYIIAETEKYAHVTYFFRGLDDKQLPSEMRVLIPSLKEKNYINHPEMSGPAITNALIRSLRTNPAFFYLVNYASPDMVGHSGNFKATVKACEIIDQQLALLYHEVVQRLNGTLIITADHGNAEEKIDAQGNQLTAHTSNPVPFIVIRKKSATKAHKPLILPEEPHFGLANAAPTILKLMGLPIPPEMEQETIF